MAHRYMLGPDEAQLSTLWTELRLGRSVKTEKSFSQNASLQITKSFPTQGFPGLLDRLRWQHCQRGGFYTEAGWLKLPQRTQTFGNTVTGNIRTRDFLHKLSFEKAVCFKCTISLSTNMKHPELLFSLECFFCFFYSCLFPHRSGVYKITAAKSAVLNAVCKQRRRDWFWLAEMFSEDKKVFQSFPRLLSENSEWLNGDKRGKHRGEEKNTDGKVGGGGAKRKSFWKLTKGSWLCFKRVRGSKGGWSASGFIYIRPDNCLTSPQEPQSSGLEIPKEGPSFLTPAPWLFFFSLLSLFFLSLFFHSYSLLHSLFHSHVLASLQSAIMKVSVWAS